MQKENKRTENNLKTTKTTDYKSTTSSFSTEGEDDYSDPELEDEIEESDNIMTFEEYFHVMPKWSVQVYLTALEQETTILKSSEAFLHTQCQITPSKREIVVKWLIQINYHFKFPSDTLYNAVTYLDICLSKINIPKKEMRLYATACYRISAKVDTRLQPSVEQLKAVTWKEFDEEKLSEIENIVIRELSFNLSYPTSKFFMRFYLDIGNSTPETNQFANIFTELALMKFEFFDQRPSIIAAASVILTFDAAGNHDGAFRVVRFIGDSSTKEITKCILCFEDYVMRLRNQASGKNNIFDSLRIPIDCNKLFK
ncbi:Cyclin, N-terminal domain containing protein [Histomonas meleagridis]|uniref:Cyclin, N-terminal domain containing protein n=1 Tax=Histomonas meleagridis TaxID=135588 RepID=UPI003559583A|nr:Cyclin, N-terminal domain containing protein [Histomonas meleagridis]KAH0798513.1 Cyclin, N-terminal domain containing protein [Histomonas meleagridis]